MAGSSVMEQLRRILGAAVKSGILAALRTLTGGKGSTGRTRTKQTQRAQPTKRSTQSSTQSSTASTSLRDYAGVPAMEYRPQSDGRPDPGEIVWTWVPYEENDGRGKDRPVLVIGRDGATLLGLMLTSKDHDRDAAQEARAGRHWTDIGAGDWDPQRRPSEIRLDRVLRIDPGAVRREGSVLPRGMFDHVAAEVTRVHQHERT